MRSNRIWYRWINTVFEQLDYLPEKFLLCSDSPSSRSSAYLSGSMVIVWTVKAIRSRKQSYFCIECTPKYPYNLDFAMVCCDLLPIDFTHCNDVIMNAIASRIISLTIVYSSVDSGADQRKHQSSVPLAFVSEIHRWPMNSPHKGPVTRKIFPFDDVIMHVIQRYFPGARAIARLPPVPVKQPYMTSETTKYDLLWMYSVSMAATANKTKCISYGIYHRDFLSTCITKDHHLWPGFIPIIVWFIMIGVKWTYIACALTNMYIVRLFHFNK